MHINQLILAYGHRCHRHEIGIQWKFLPASLKNVHDSQCIQGAAQELVDIK